MTQVITPRTARTLEEALRVLRRRRTGRPRTKPRTPRLPTYSIQKRDD